LEEELKGKQVHDVVVAAGNAGLMHHQKDKEDLEEISNELELADEEEKVPYVLSVDIW